MKCFFVVILLYAVQHLSGQDQLPGDWVGVITQDEGGFRSEYNFEMYLKIEGKVVTGRSYVTIEGIYAEMSLTGFMVDATHFRFSETRVVRSKKMPDMDWCLKGGTLELKKEWGRWKLEGRWEGISTYGPCIPGKIVLSKAIPRV